MTTAPSLERNAPDTSGDRFDPKRPSILLIETGGSPDLRRKLHDLNYDVIVSGASFAENQPACPLVVIVDGDSAETFEACARLPADLPKILVTPTVSFEIRCAAARVNIDAVLSSPVDVSELSYWLERYDMKRAAPSISVLLVEDDPNRAAAHAAVLRAAGIEVATVDDAALVLDAIDSIWPDLVLMDLKMPGVGGVDLAKVVRQCSRHLSLPIVFLAGETDERREMTARRFGGDDFLVKPIDPERLVATVRLRASRARNLRWAYEHDSLTGLLNRASFGKQAGQALTGSGRPEGPSSFAMIDIDGFKTLNDRHGHRAGDMVITTLARVLKARLRTSDLVGRWGGEEFAVVLMGAYPEDAARVLDEIRLSFSSIVFESAIGSFSARFSHGIVPATGDIETMAATAEHAMTATKAAGRDHTHVAAAAWA